MQKRVILMTQSPQINQMSYLILILKNPLPKEIQRMNSRGKDLLDMCKSLDLIISNGRKSGDLFGHYTCFRWNGNSVVDYLVTSSSVFKKVSTFEVADFFPWLSDHSPLYFTIEVHSPVAKDTQNDLPKSKAPKQYIW